MPVHEVKKNGKLIGYKYGISGKLYTIAKYGRNKAKVKAIMQGAAIQQSQKEQGKTPIEPIVRN